MSRPSDFPVMMISSVTNWNDDSSGEDSYISMFKQSVGTDISNLSDNNANYKYIPSVLPESLSSVGALVSKYILVPLDFILMVVLPNSTQNPLISSKGLSQKGMS
mmetsp:Transcript_24353/g.37520  ORF Transcript_24353/g.37520 Transcript_24353/m.37520 type:complete len:105 (-) Transcript_24353:80-394(-)